MIRANTTQVAVVAAFLYAAQPSLAADMAVKAPEHGLPVGGWMFSPSLFVGGFYDSNVNQSQNNRRSSAGVRVVPSFVGRWGDGIHDTQIYGVLDGRYYTQDVVGSHTVVAARAGGTHVYSPLPDLSFEIATDYTRDRDFLNAASGLGNINNPPPPNPFGILSLSNPDTFNQLAGSVSVRKSVDRAFVTLTGRASTLRYDSTPAGTANRDGDQYAVQGRVGFWATPIINVFAETTADWRRFATAAFDSEGYRVIGGIGTDQIGLFRGEIYGGYQEQKRSNLPLKSSTAVYGGRLNYYPTEYLTIYASVDQVLGVSTAVVTPTSPFGASTKGTVALTQAKYAMSEFWSVALRTGYVHTEYVETTRRDDGWIAGATWSYFFWRSLGLTVDYQYSQMNSNVPLNSYTRHVVTAGATYRY